MKKEMKTRNNLLLIVCLLYILINLCSCNKRYECQTRTTYKQNPWKSFDEEIPPTSYTVTVTRKEAKKLDGQKIEIYGNGLITKSETNCNIN